MAQITIRISADTTKARQRIRLLEQWIAIGLYHDDQHDAWVSFVSGGISASVEKP